jgi:predicted dehydrogenase
MKTIQWGMIGCGDVTEVKSGPAFNKVANSQLLDVTGRSEARVLSYAQRHGVPRPYAEINQLLADPDIHAVYVATPPSTHMHYTLMAAQAGKAVYVEKPMALNYTECLRMIDACQAEGVPLFTAYYRRSLPKFLKIKELLDQNAIGEVRLVSIHLLLPPRPEDLRKEALPWRVLPEISGGGYMVDVGSHQLDLLDFFFGPIEAVAGRKSNQARWYPAEDIVCAHFRFASGILGSAIWCFTLPNTTPMDRTEIVGSSGKITYTTFDSSPIRLETGEGMQELQLPWPQHVQQPHIETIVRELLGIGKCPSTGVTGARTTRIIDEVLGSTL